MLWLFPVFETKSNISCSLRLGRQWGGRDLGQACQKAAVPDVHRGDVDGLGWGETLLAGEIYFLFLRFCPSLK